ARLGNSQWFDGGFVSVNLQASKRKPSARPPAGPQRDGLHVGPVSDQVAVHLQFNQFGTARVPARRAGSQQQRQRHVRGHGHSSRPAPPPGHGRNRTASNSKPRHASASSRTCYEPAPPDARRGLPEAFPVQNRQGSCHNPQTTADTAAEPSSTEPV